MDAFEVDGGEDRLLGSENGHSPEMKIEVRHPTKVSKNDVRILNQVKLDIPKGVIMGVIGLSGSGKSTFLLALNRLWEPASASVFLDGVDICQLDVLSLRRKVGMLFQLPVLFEGTVADNVRYGPQLKGTKLNDDEVYKLLALADLDSSFHSKSGGELSVGQAQRVALASGPAFNAGRSIWLPGCLNAINENANSLFFLVHQLEPWLTKN